MTKRDLLVYLAHTADADARGVVRAFDVRYSVAAMALLRLVRQGLASRELDVKRGIYRYRLSDRGRARLVYLQRER